MRLSDVLFKEELFYAKINKSPDGCWEWSGSLQTRGNPRRGGGRRMGYGQFGVRYADKNKKKGTLLAHRLMWILIHGEADDSMVICHHCDNPKCVRPDHLYMASQSQNVRDSVGRGRHAMANRTHCPSGHEYSAENTLREKTSAGYVERKCRQCHNDRQRRYRQSKKVAGEQGLEP